MEKINYFLITCIIFLLLSCGEKNPTLDSKENNDSSKNTSEKYSDKVNIPGKYTLADFYKNNPEAGQKC